MTNLSCVLKLLIIGQIIVTNTNRNIKSNKLIMYERRACLKDRSTLLKYH